MLPAASAPWERRVLGGRACRIAAGSPAEVAAGGELRSVTRIALVSVVSNRECYPRRADCAHGNEEQLEQLMPEGGTTALLTTPEMGRRGSESERKKILREQRLPSDGLQHTSSSANGTPTLPIILTYHIDRYKDAL